MKWKDSVTIKFQILFCSNIFEDGGDTSWEVPCLFFGIKPKFWGNEPKENIENTVAFRAFMEEEKTQKRKKRKRKKRSKDSRKKKRRKKNEDVVTATVV